MQTLASPTYQTHPHEHIESILSGFTSYGLTDLDKANLMDRVDVKFVLPTAFLPTLLEQLKNDYRVLDIKGKRISEYHNRYFDTPELDFYNAHHNGKLNRYKVRERTYVDTDTQFLEVKFKNDRKRTIKTRINCHADKADSMTQEAFLQQEMQTAYDKLEVSQYGGYQRIALANEAAAERLTLDFDLWYSLTKKEQTIKLPHFFIAELKQQKHSKFSPFYQLMSKNNLFPVSFSKYCIGCTMLYPNMLKKNQFNGVLRHIAKFSPSLHSFKPTSN